ncbi:tetratricopeptide repeat protein [Quadrisphaera granulorum]|nr:tetratricopeptide repeat protein [Quadrisphaera granulorum]
MTETEVAEDDDGGSDLYCEGYDLAEAGEHERAVVVFTRSAELGYADALHALGNSLRELDRTEEAVRAFTDAEAAGVTESILNLGHALRELGDADGAEAAYQRAREAGDPTAPMCLATLWRRRGDDAPARELLERSAAEGNAWSAGELALWMLADLDDDLDAVEPGGDIETLLRRAADVDGDARADLAWVLRRRGELDEAEALLRTGHEQGDWDCSIKLAVLLDEDRGDVTEAEQVLRAAAAAGELFAWNNLGLLLRDQGRLLEAEDALRRGARGGDALAVKNLRALRRDYRRQLGRAHRRTARESVNVGHG